MKPHRPFRFPVASLAILLAMLLIGSAAIRLGKLEPEVSTDLRQSRELAEIFNQCQALFRERLEKPELARKESELVWYDALILKAEYLGIADRLQTDLGELNLALSEPSKNRADLQRRVNELKSW